MSQEFNPNFRRGQSIKMPVTIERLTNDNLDYNANTNPYIPVNLTNCTAKMQWRKSVDKSVVLEASTTAGGGNGKLVIDDPLTGVITLLLAPADTEALRFTGDSIEYGYDLEITDAAGDKTYPIYGTITMDKDYTR